MAFTDADPTTIGGVSELEKCQRRQSTQPFSAHLDFIPTAFLNNIFAQYST
jgi:hypothetical protein